MDKDQKINISVELTPNPQSMKFTLSNHISKEVWEVSDVQKASRSPLAQKILGFPWAIKVFIGLNFITINKEDWVDWEVLIDPLSQMIKEHIESGQVVLYPKQNVETNENSTMIIKDQDLPTVQKIKKILESEVQPAVAMDGGFITFAGYEKGTVFLKMQGACAGCPSSSITLKQGIENHLKNQISEVKEVVAV